MMGTAVVAISTKASGPHGRSMNSASGFGSSSGVASPSASSTVEREASSSRSPGTSAAVQPIPAGGQRSRDQTRSRRFQRMGTACIHRKVTVTAAAHPMAARGSSANAPVSTRYQSSQRTSPAPAPRRPAPIRDAAVCFRSCFTSLLGRGGGILTPLPAGGDTRGRSR